MGPTNTIEVHSELYPLRLRMLGDVTNRNERFLNAIATPINPSTMGSKREMLNGVLSINQELREQLKRMTIDGNEIGSLVTTNTSECDVVVTPNEMNNKHGTGSLVRRIFDGCSNIVSIRARNDYGGDHDFGEQGILLPQAGRRSDAFRQVLNALSGRLVRRVACIPYISDDLITSIAIKELFDAPLCAYIMDDQNISVQAISDNLMREFLTKASLRLTTHPEMRDAYEDKFGLKFWLLPAVVPGRLLQSTANEISGQKYYTKTGALVGSIWSRRWFEMLRDTIKSSGYRCNWYGNNNSPYVKTPQNELEDAGITPFGIAPEDELAARLREYPYAVVPTGTLDEGEDARALAQLSLPGRILFVLATSNTPVIILGSDETPAANFVEQFQVGVTSSYDPQSFRRAVEKVSAPETQFKMRQNAAAMAQTLSADKISEWFWRSLEIGEPCDRRFEDLFYRYQVGSIFQYVEPPVPRDIHKDYISVYQALRRLKYMGFNPDFIIDVGSAMGMWSHTISRLFKDARFVLIDPLMSKYNKDKVEFHINSIPKAELIEAVVADQPGHIQFKVSSDLYSSSFVLTSNLDIREIIDVEAITIDQLAESIKISGRGILKADAQGAEHLVLKGASRFLTQVDAIIVEVSMLRFEKNAKTFLEILQLLDNLGFRYFDVAGSWRPYPYGVLLQEDVLFLRHGLFATSPA